MSEFKQKLKHILKEDFAYSSIHGFSNIANNKHLPIKIFWAISVLVSTSVCSYLIVSSVLNYLKYEVTTKMSVISETTSPFPTISICNSASLVAGNSSSFGFELLSQGPFAQYINYVDANNSFEPNKFVAQYFLRQNEFVLNTETRKSYGLSIDQMLITCLYAGSPCSSSDFVWYYDLMYGNCFRFNTGTNSTLKTSTNTGKWNGLRLELYVGSTNDIEMNQPSTGVHLFIHNNTNTLDSMKGFDAATSTESNIAVSRKFSSRLSEP